MVFNQQMFDAEKRKFGESLALDRDSKREKLHTTNQAAEAAKNAPPEGFERHFTAGEPIYRGEVRDTPVGVTTPAQMLSHMFPGGKGDIGGHWSLRESIANRFSRVTEKHAGDFEGKAKVKFHSSVNPTDVSYDNGRIPDAGTGKEVNWGPNWKERVGRPSPMGDNSRVGDRGEAELIMRNDTEIPIHGVTMRFGASMNYHQFDEPLKGVSKNYLDSKPPFSRSNRGSDMFRKDTDSE